MERDREHRLEDRHARPELELAHRLGGPTSSSPPRSARRTTRCSRFRACTIRGEHNGSVPASGEHRWLVYDIDFETGAVRWVRELHRAVPGNHPGTSRTATPRRRRSPTANGSTCTSAPSGWSRPSTSRATRSGAATSGRSTRCRRWPLRRPRRLHDGRLYVLNDNTTQVVPRGAGRRDRRGRVAGRARRAGTHLVDAPSCGRTPSAPRS